MNHTGVRSTGSRLRARTRSGSATSERVPGTLSAGRPPYDPPVQRAGEHPVLPGPLAVRWLAYELPGSRAGVTAVARVALENAGSATWRSRGTSGVQLAYHWL